MKVSLAEQRYEEAKRRAEEADLNVVLYIAFCLGVPVMFVIGALITAMLPK